MLGSLADGFTFVFDRKDGLTLEAGENVEGSNRV